MIGTFGMGQAGSGLRFSQTRGRIQGGAGYGLNYPNPFFDIAHTYLPTTIKQMFRWCRYYFLTNPLINTVVFKMSEYPVTDIIIDHPDKQVVNRWTEYFQDHLRYRAFQVESGLDYNCYGNCLASIGYPFKKYLTCRSCRKSEPAEKLRPYWQLVNYEFRLTCPSCHQTAEAIAHDQYVKNANGIRMIRWNPEDVEISYNDITGEYTHFYTVPATVRNDITMGKKDVVENIPQIFIQALKEQKGIIFSKQNLFHLRRPTLATQDRGWGIPLLLPVLKDVFYLQIMRKAQETILLEHALPLRVLFPQAGSGSSDPFTSINLVEWREHVSAEVARWRYDPAYIPVMPLPIGHQVIGGDGRALLLTQEMQQHNESIVAGMGVPREFVFGGLTWSGSNVSLRMLENMFLGYILRHKAMARWVMQEVSAYLGWPMAKIRFKPFKMADDLQRKAFNFQLNQAGKLSDTTLLADSDFSQSEENEIMVKETSARLEATKVQQIAMAEIQGEQQVIMAKYQVKAQQVTQEAMAAQPAPGEPGGQDGTSAGTPGGQQADQAGSPAAAMQSPLSQGQKLAPGQVGGDLRQMAYLQAKTIAAMPPDQQQMALQNLMAQSPDLAELVMQALRTMGVQIQQPGGQQQPANAGVDMRPLPEQRAPRRQLSLV